MGCARPTVRSQPSELRSSRSRERASCRARSRALGVAPRIATRPAVSHSHPEPLRARLEDDASAVVVAVGLGDLEHHGGAREPRSVACRVLRDEARHVRVAVRVGVVQVQLTVVRVVRRERQAEQAAFASGADEAAHVQEGSGNDLAVGAHLDSAGLLYDEQPVRAVSGVRHEHGGVESPATAPARAVARPARPVRPGCRRAARFGRGRRRRRRPRRFPRSGGREQQRERCCGERESAQFRSRARSHFALASESERIAATTSSAWPSSFTFGQTFAIRPSGSIRNVERTAATPRTLGAERADHGLLGIRDHREGEVVLVHEALLDLSLVRADAHHEGVEGLQFARCAWKSFASCVQPGVLARGKKYTTTHRPWWSARRKRPSFVDSASIAGDFSPGWGITEDSALWAPVTWDVVPRKGTRTPEPPLSGSASGVPLADALIVDGYNVTMPDQRTAHCRRSGSARRCVAGLAVRAETGGAGQDGRRVRRREQPGTRGAVSERYARSCRPPTTRSWAGARRLR